MPCLDVLGDGAWHQGRWDWANGTECGFHMHSRAEAQRLLSGRQVLFLGNSVLRHTMYATLNLLVGATVNKSACPVCGQDAIDPSRAVFDMVSKEAVVNLVDLTAGTFRLLGPSGLCHMFTCRTYMILPPSERGQGSALERVTVQVDWIVGWSEWRDEGGEGARGEGARGRGERQQAAHERRLRASLTSLLDAGGWCAPGPGRRSSGLNCTREADADLDSELLLRVRPSDVHAGGSQVTAWLFARGTGQADSVQWASRLALRALAPRLTAWARAPCEGPVAQRLPCALVSNVTVDISGGSGYSNCSLKCPRVSYEESVSRAVAQFVPAGHEWAVLSHAFSWTGVEDGQFLHLCTNWDEWTWGYGADYVVAAPSAVEDSAASLLPRRGVRGECFNTRNKSGTLLIRDPHRGQPNQIAAVRSLLASGAAAGKDTHVWSYSSALQAAKADNSSGVRQVDHIHYNDAGKLFTAQMLLNALHALQPPSSEGPAASPRLASRPPPDRAAARSERRAERHAGSPEREAATRASLAAAIDQARREGFLEGMRAAEREAAGLGKP